jgi:hypothetical protein
MSKEAPERIPYELLKSERARRKVSRSFEPVTLDNGDLSRDSEGNVLYTKSSTPEEMILRKESIEIKNRFHAMRDILEEDFKGTAWTGERKWGEADVAVSRQALLDVAPYLGIRIFNDFCDHLVLSSIFARKLAEKTGLNPHEMDRALGLIFHGVITPQK